MFCNVNGMMVRAELKKYLERPARNRTSCLFAALARPDCNVDKVKEIIKLRNDNIACHVDPHTGNTTLHVAILNPHCNVDIIKLLVQNGANIAAKNDIDQTVLHIALEHSIYNHNIIDELLNYDIPLNELDYNEKIDLTYDVYQCGSDI